jgi:hypothetical protein
LKPSVAPAPIISPKPLPAKVTDLEASLATLSTAASDVLKLLHAEAKVRGVSHADRADLTRIELAVSDLLRALRA